MKYSINNISQAPINRSRLEHPGKARALVAREWDEEAYSCLHSQSDELFSKLNLVDFKTIS